MSGESDARALLESFAGFVTRTAAGADEASQNRPIRLATVAPGYGGTGPVPVIFDGETVAGVRTYLTLAPVLSGNRVVMLPVGNSYVVLGTVDSQPPATSPARNLIRNARFRVNQIGRTSASSGATFFSINEYVLDGWKKGNGGSHIGPTWTGDDDTGRVITVPSNWYWTHNIEQRDIIPGTHVLSWEGTHNAGRVYNAGDTPPATAASPIIVELDGTDDVIVEFVSGGTVSDVSLVRAPAPTEHFPDISYEEDLRWCQRFYWRLTVTASVDAFTGVGIFFSSSLLSTFIPLPTTMRTIPTFQYGFALSDFVVRHGGSGGSGQIPANLVLIRCSQQLAEVQASGLSSATPWGGGYLRGATANGWLSFSAEM